MESGGGLPAGQLEAEAGVDGAEAALLVHVHEQAEVPEVSDPLPLLQHRNRELTRVYFLARERCL